MTPADEALMWMTVLYGANFLLCEGRGGRERERVELVQYDPSKNMR